MCQPDDNRWPKDRWQLVSKKGAHRIISKICLSAGIASSTAIEKESHHADESSGKSALNNNYKKITKTA
jgi:hypothetical protein